MTRNVGIYIYDDVEVLDFAGPFEVFSTASRMKTRLTPDASKPFEVFTVAEEIRPMRARAGLMITPSFDIRQHPRIDLLLIPGGVHDPELKRQNVIQWIAHTAAKAELTASICTGAFLLAKAGLLKGATVTTHWEDIPEFRAMYPNIPVHDNIRWADVGSIVTSAGVSAGIDMSLHLVARLQSEELALRTARQLDYDWRRSAQKTV